MTPQEARSGSPKTSKRFLLLLLCSAVVIAVMNSSMVNVAVPVIRQDFGVSEAQVGWVITSYLLTYAVGIPLYGRAADVFSLRRAFSLGLVGFAVGSLLCVVAPNLPLLVFGRVVQATGAAAIPALASASVAKVLAPGERGTALGFIVSSVGVGAAVGPVVGGALQQLAGWQSLFYATLALTLLLLPGAFYALPETRSSGERSFDVPGGILLGSAAGLFLFGITQGQVAGFASISSWGSFAGAAIAAVGFAWRITGAEHPFVSPALFRNRGYVAAVIVGYFSMLVNVSCLVSVPLLVSQANGLSPGTTGLVLAPGAVALAILSPLAGRLSDRIGFKAPVYAGLAIMLLSVLFISTFGAGAAPYLVAVGMLGVGTGFAFTNSPNVNAAAAALPKEETGVGLGIFNGLFFLGGGTGPAVVGAFLAARREAGTGALNPLYALDAAPFSDSFLILTTALLLSLAASLGMRSSRKAQAPETHNKEG
jgi:DHA2 family metal-tetracycline-proton antiporter-like MFS transporter/DHA2 family florfenicol/chloramphenicol resistance protein-like MFS transporter